MSLNSLRITDYVNSATCAEVAEITEITEVAEVENNKAVRLFIGTLDNSGQQLETNTLNEKIKNTRIAGIIAMAVGILMCIVATALIAGVGFPLIPIAPLFALALAACVFGAVLTAISTNAMTEDPIIPDSVSSVFEGSVTGDSVTDDPDLGDLFIEGSDSEDKLDNAQDDDSLSGSNFAAKFDDTVSSDENQSSRSSSISSPPDMPRQKKVTFSGIDEVIDIDEMIDNDEITDNATGEKRDLNQWFEEHGIKQKNRSEDMSTLVELSYEDMIELLDYDLTAIPDYLQGIVGQQIRTLFDNHENDEQKITTLSQLATAFLEGIKANNDLAQKLGRRNLIGEYENMMPYLIPHLKPTEARKYKKQLEDFVKAVN